MAISNFRTKNGKVRSLDGYALENLNSEGWYVVDVASTRKKKSTKFKAQPAAIKVNFDLASLMDRGLQVDLSVFVREEPRYFQEPKSFGTRLYFDEINNEYILQPAIECRDDDNNGSRGFHTRIVLSTLKRFHELKVSCNWSTAVNGVGKPVRASDFLMMKVSATQIKFKFVPSIFSVHSSTSSELLSSKIDYEKPKPVFLAPAENELDEQTRSVVERTTNQLKRDSSFRSRVLRAHGHECVCCGMNLTDLIEAAHVVAVKDGGNDKTSNGMPLCATHHTAFDKYLWTIDPSTKEIVPADGLTREALAITKQRVAIDIEVAATVGNGHG